MPVDAVPFAATHSWLFYGRGGIADCGVKGSVLSGADVHSHADTRRSMAHIETIRVKELEMLARVGSSSTLLAEVVADLNRRWGSIPAGIARFQAILQGCVSIAVMQRWHGGEVGGLTPACSAVTNALRDTPVLGISTALAESVLNVAVAEGVRLPFLRFLTGLGAEGSAASWWAAVGTLIGASHLSPYLPLFTDVFLPAWCVHVGGEGARHLPSAVGATLLLCLERPDVYPPAMVAGLLRCPDAVVADHADHRNRFVRNTLAAVFNVVDVVSLVAATNPILDSHHYDVFTGAFLPGILQQTAMEWPWAAYVDKWERLLDVAHQWGELEPKRLEEAIVGICGDCGWARPMVRECLGLGSGVSIPAIRDHHLQLLKTLARTASYAPRLALALAAGCAVLDPKSSSERSLRMALQDEASPGSKRERAEEVSDSDDIGNDDEPRDEDGSASPSEQRRRRLQSRSPRLRCPGVVVYLDRVMRDANETSTDGSVSVRHQLRLALPLRSALSDLHAFALASRTSFEDQHQWLIRTRAEQGAKFGLLGPKAIPRGPQRVPMATLMDSLEETQVVQPGPLSSTFRVVADETLCSHLMRMMWTTACYTALRDQAVDEARRKGGVSGVFRRAEEIRATIDPRALSKGLLECAMRATSTLPVTVEVKVSTHLTINEKEVHHQRQAAMSLVRAVIQLTQLHSPDETATLLLSSPLPTEGPLQRPNPYQGIVGAVLGEMLATRGFDEVPHDRYVVGVSTPDALPKPFPASWSPVQVRRMFHPLTAFAFEEWGAFRASSLVDTPLLTLERFLSEVILRLYVSERLAFYVDGTSHDRFLVGAQEVAEGMLLYARVVFGGEPPFVCTNNLEGANRPRGMFIRHLANAVTESLLLCLARQPAPPSSLLRECREWVRFMDGLGLVPRGLPTVRAV